MGAVAVIFVVCMISKDVTFAPFPNALRTVSQTLCLLAGVSGIASHFTVALLPRYWLVLTYLGVLIVCAPFTTFPFFVLLQVMSLASAIVFAVAFFDAAQQARDKRLRMLVACIVLTYGTVIILSLLVARFEPTLVYERLFAGNETGYEIRFRGMFSKAGGMGAASGLLLGLAAIFLRRWWVKLSIIGPAAICLALTQSRSFWIASLLAGCMTLWMYFPNWRKRLIVCSGIVGLVVMTYIALNFTVDTSDLQAFGRVNTVANLTGRTELWDFARKGWSGKPWLGYGLTLGGLVLEGDRAIPSDADPTQFSRQTLHSGYVQSMMDSGAIGFLLYAMIILVAITRLVRYDSRRQYPEVLYVLLFLSIANLGESVIYSGSVFHSLCFWIFAVFAMGLDKRTLVQKNGENQDLAGADRNAMPFFPNLMR